VKVGIINVTGYSGMELARILHRHPDVDLVSVTGRSAAGQTLAEVFPHLADINMTIKEDLDASVDLVFSSLPQVASAEACVPLVRSGIKVIDISADFRLHSAALYQQWYKTEHPAPDLLETSVYGLSELDRDGVRSATLIANPGCYPEAALLALAPVVRAGLIEPDIIIDAKSGVSGAGRSPNMVTHFAEINENIFAYSVDGHRHLPEIVQELGRMRDGFDPKVIFTPHLIPMTRGILDSCYARFTPDAFASVELASRGVRELYEEFYKDEAFVKVMSAPPQTKQTWGNNNCLIYPTVDPHTGHFKVFSVLDNLVKGAAGQAVQNMNLMSGFPENTGLEQLAIYP
jgi:N-acetyl-gamma-glutamyl-phosphate reductase